MKCCIYTAHLGNYDEKPTLPTAYGWDKIIITDSKEGFNGWDKIIRVKPSNNPVLESRRYKWLSHIYLPEYELACYFDANMYVYRSPPKEPFRIRHYKRDNVRQECDALNALLHRVKVSDVEDFYKSVTEKGFKDESELWLNGFFARLHDEKSNKVCQDTFDLCCKYIPRDQVVFSVAIQDNSYEVENRKDKRFFLQHIRMKAHAPKPITLYERPEIKVHHITPARSDKNFGKSINDLVKNFAPSDWIALRDIDTLPLDHVSFIKQCEEIANSGVFDLVSGMTNRLGLNYQLVGGKMSENTDMAKEVNLAKSLALKHGSKVDPINETVAGFFMLFSKDIWDKVKGFPEGAIMINGEMVDYIFSKKVIEKGGKIGIAQGIYLFHLYRWGKNRKDKSHLI
jgi:hypothetical protein